MLGVYVEHLAPLFPAITSQEVRNIGSLTAFQILALCSLTSLSRTVPRVVCVAFRSRLFHLLETVPGGNLWTSNHANLTALMILSMSSELHGINSSGAGSVNFLRTGVLIRMAMDLGLHRSRDDPGGSASINDRTNRRLWSLCMIHDVWYVNPSCVGKLIQPRFALMYGQPPFIDEAFVETPSPDIGVTVHEQYLHFNDKVPSSSLEYVHPAHKTAAQNSAAHP